MKDLLDLLVDEDDNSFDELEEGIQGEDFSVPKELASRIAILLNVHKDAIQEIVEVEPKIYVVSLETDEDVFTNFSYSAVDDSIYEIPDVIKSKKQYLTEEEKEQYYLENKRLINFALKKINRPDGVEFHELEDVGTFGFVKALNTFDLSNGTKFSTYAVKCVLNEVYYFLRKEQRHLAMEDSMDKVLTSDNQGNALTLEDTISSTMADKDRTTEQKVLQEELRKTLLDCLSYLLDDEQYLIIYRYGLDNNIILTQTEIAETLNMSQANISKLEKTCLKKLRTILKRNNYVYDAKDKTLSLNDKPLIDMLKVDDNEAYIDRNARENIEVAVCSLLNLDITDVNDVIPTTEDHVYLVTFSMQDRVAILFNNIVNKYEFVSLPISRRDKFLYMVYGIQLKNRFDRDDIMNPEYHLDVSDRDFNKLMKTLDKTKIYILTYKYGLYDKDIKTIDNIAEDLNMASSEVYKLEREAMRELRATVLKKKKRKPRKIEVES